MDETLPDASILQSQLKALRADVERIEPETADRPGRPGSGITAFIPHFNSVLQRFRELFSANPIMLKCVAHIEPVQEIQEILSASYHQRAKANIVAGAGSMLSALESYLQNAGGDSTINELQNFLKELDAIYGQAVSSGQTDLGWEQLERWKKRIFRFVDEKVSAEEAEAFHGEADLFTDLADEIARCKSSLVGLLKELHSHPEKVIKRAAIPVSTELAAKGDRQLKSVLSAVPAMPAEVTLSWLWHNVPVRLWSASVSLLVAVFIAGAYLGRVPALRSVFALLPGNPQAAAPTLPPERVEQIAQKVKELIAAHNERLAALQQQLLYEERLAGDHSLISSYRETHRAAGEKLRELIEKENENFRRELEVVRQFYQ